MTGMAHEDVRRRAVPERMSEPFADARDVFDDVRVEGPLQEGDDLVANAVSLDRDVSVGCVLAPLLPVAHEVFA